MRNLYTKIIRQQHNFTILLLDKAMTFLLLMNVKHYICQ